MWWPIPSYGAARYRSPAPVLPVGKEAQQFYKPKIQVSNIFYESCSGGKIENVQWITTLDIFDKNRIYKKYSGEDDNVEPEDDEHTFYDFFQTSCEHNHLEIVQYLYKENAEYFNDFDYENTVLDDDRSIINCMFGTCMENNSIECFKFLINKWNFNIAINNKLLISSFNYPCVEITIFLYESLELHLRSNILQTYYRTFFITNDSLKLFKWIHELNTFEMDFENLCLDACRTDSLEIVEWAYPFCKKNIIDKMFEISVEYSFDKIINWIYNLNKIDKIKGFKSLACYFPDSDIIDKLYNKIEDKKSLIPIFSSIIDFFLVRYKIDYEKIKTLLNKNWIDIDDDLFYKIMGTEDKKLINIFYLVKFNFSNSDDIFIHSCQFKFCKMSVAYIKSILEDINLHKDDDQGIKNCIIYNNLRMIKLLYPKDERINKIEIWKSYERLTSNNKTLKLLKKLRSTIFLHD